MALTKTVTLPGGIEVSNAYHRIERLEFYSPRIGSDLAIEVAVYKDAQSRNDETQSPISIVGYQLSAPEDRGTNIMEYSYNKLKKLPAYEGAIDA